MSGFLIQDLSNNNSNNKLKFTTKLTTPERVLILEDDLSLTNLLRSVLEDISPTVEIDWAISGEEAKKNLKDQIDILGQCQYQLIVADIFLEGETTGLDIWKLCEENFPQTKILIMSSLPAKKILSSLKNKDLSPPYLQKPFTRTECKKALNNFFI